MAVGQAKVGVRDPKNTAGPTLTFPAARWRAFSPGTPENGWSAHLDRATPCTPIQSARQTIARSGRRDRLQTGTEPGRAPSPATKSPSDKRKAGRFAPWPSLVAGATGPNRAGPAYSSPMTGGAVFPGRPKISRTSPAVRIFVLCS
ncbi:MAG TPA: DUF397 domain-containing protein [Pseudonocardiaceae bacterium]|nr:DUF397 domain-containing protein [Pseudonocardiaceae bacterium]